MTSWLIVGLGNPGRDYAGHRHNVGFMTADALADKYGTGAWKNVFQSQLHAATIDGDSVLIQKPQTYMNLSGEAVGACMRFYKIPLDHIIVIHDELDIPALTVRIKQGGGNGGHNGLKSIDHLCGNAYWRIRMGIGHPGNKDLVTAHVLNDFCKEEEEPLEKLITKLVADFGLMLQGNAGKLASNLAPPAPPKEKKEKKEQEDGI